MLLTLAFQPEPTGSPAQGLATLVVLSASAISIAVQILRPNPPLPKPKRARSKSRHARKHRRAAPAKRTDLRQ